MAFRAQGQGHLQGQMSKLNQKYISRVQLYPFKVSICILRSRFVSFTIRHYIPSIFKPKRGSSLVTMDTYRRTLTGLLVQSLPPLLEIRIRVVLFDALNFLNG